MAVGLNCLIFGKDLERFIDATCTRFFNMVYIMRYTTGVAGLAILFSMCCATCSGVRHFKQLERSRKKVHAEPDRSINYADTSMVNLKTTNRKPPKDEDDYETTRRNNRDDDY